MAHEMSVAETPATTLCARAADGGAGASNPLDEFGPAHVVKRGRGRPKGSGKPFTEAHKAALRGPKSPEHRAKLMANLGAANVQPLPPEFFASIRDGVAHGLSARGIGERLGVSKDAIIGAARRQGISLNGGGAKLTAQHRANISAGRKRNGRPAAATACAPNHCTAEQLLHEPLSHGGTL